MDIQWYTYDGWEPRIRPASPRRAWMDATPDSFAYRCLPLAIANAHGWELLSPCGFVAVWDGSAAPDGVRIVADAGSREAAVPEALFGNGTVTFHVEGIVRTPPGWNLWVGGSPNRAKDGIAPLAAVIETDWSPYTFTMNWRFTRPGHPVRFEENEPFAFIFPVQRGVVDAAEPRVLPIEQAPELKAQFEEWSRSRNAFHEQMRTDPPASSADRWQKLYYRGLDPRGCPHAGEHQTRIRPAAFAGALPTAEPVEPVAPVAPAPLTAPAAPPPPSPDCEVALARRDWLLGSLIGLASLSPRASGLLRYQRITADQFLHDHYAANRPALLTDEIADWPALRLWTPQYLKARLGSAPVEYQGGRGSNPDYERYKDVHRAVMPFDAFIDRIEGAGDGNDAYITAYNCETNLQSLAPLANDLGRLDHLLDPQGGFPDGMAWIGPAGTFTPLHHDLTNNLLVQITGRKRVILVPSTEVPRLYNDQHVFSRVRDLENVDLAEFPELARLRLMRLDLNAGEALFIPLGWWHQVVSYDFSVSITYTNFRWRNDFYQGFA